MNGPGFGKRPVFVLSSDIIILLSLVLNGERKLGTSQVNAWLLVLLLVSIAVMPASGNGVFNPERLGRLTTPEPEPGRGNADEPRNLKAKRASNIHPATPPTRRHAAQGAARLQQCSRLGSGGRAGRDQQARKDCGAAFSTADHPAARLRQRPDLAARLKLRDSGRVIVARAMNDILDDNKGAH